MAGSNLETYSLKPETWKERSFKFHVSSFIILLVSCFLLLSSFAAPVFAGVVPDADKLLQDPTNCYTWGDYSVGAFLDLAQNVVKFLFGISGSLALLMFIYGGFLWLISQGDSKRIQQGQDTLVHAATGLVIIFGSWVLVNFVVTTLVSDSTTPLAKKLIGGKWAEYEGGECLSLRWCIQRCGGDDKIQDRPPLKRCKCNPMAQPARTGSAGPSGGTPTIPTGATPAARTVPAQVTAGFPGDGGPSPALTQPPAQQASPPPPPAQGKCCYIIPMSGGFAAKSIQIPVTDAGKCVPLSLQSPVTDPDKLGGTETYCADKSCPDIKKNPYTNQLVGDWEGTCK